MKRLAPVKQPPRPAAESFVIDTTREMANGKVEVYVRFDKGARVFIFPKTYPNSTILAHIRVELRKIDIDEAIAGRRKKLLGRHDL